jgi:hypothetical protein
MNEPNKLECHFALGWKGSQGTNTPAYWVNSYVNLVSGGDCCSFPSLLANKTQFLINVYTETSQST